MIRRVIGWALILLSSACLGLASYAGSQTSAGDRQGRTAALVAAFAISGIAFGWYWVSNRARIGVLLAGVAFLVWALLPALIGYGSAFSEQIIAVIGAVLLVAGAIHFAERSRSGT
jgi:peptidoglycan/LPS O-acetylase OafA/YrhL